MHGCNILVWKWHQERECFVEALLLSAWYGCQQLRWDHFPILTLTWNSTVFWGGRSVFAQLYFCFCNSGFMLFGKKRMKCHFQAMCNPDVLMPSEVQSGSNSVLYSLWGFIIFHFFLVGSSTVFLVLTHEAVFPSSASCLQVWACADFHLVLSKELEFFHWSLITPSSRSFLPAAADLQNLICAES